MIRIRHLTLALLAIAPAAAFAQDAPDPYATQTTAAEADTASNDGAKRFAVVGGYSLSEPTRNPQLGDSRMQVDGDGAATLSASYYVTDNIAVEAWGAVDKFGHRVNIDGQKAGSVEAQPYAVSGQYHFGNAGQTVRPYVGLGYYQTNFDGESTIESGALAGQRLAVESPEGAIASAGVDVKLSPSWFARADMRYLQGKSDVMLDGANAGEAELNPVMLGIGLGARF